VFSSISCIQGGLMIKKGFEIAPNLFYWKSQLTSRCTGTYQADVKLQRLSAFDEREPYINR